MAHRGSKFVKCPFYKNHDSNRIKCEGLSEGSSIHLVFEDSKERINHMRTRCNDIFLCGKCIIHQALYYKWEDK